MANYETVNESDSDSDLSDPPLSPRGLLGTTITVDSNSFNEKQTIRFENGNDNDDLEPMKLISPYLDCKPEHGERVDEGSIADAENFRDPSVVENSQLPFPEFTDIEEFEEYLKDPEDMAYKMLYSRTAVVSKALAAYQKEFESIDREVNRYELVTKAQKERADEMIKEHEAKRLMEEDAQRAKVAEIYSAELRLVGSEWDKFLKEFGKKIPVDRKTFDHLQNLRDPIFMATVQKRQTKTEKPAPRLINVPKKPVKVSKEEERNERKLRLGRAIQPEVFDDRKMADVYGFEWSAKEDHIGRQPLDRIAALRNVMGGSKGRITRKPREQSRKRYDDEDAGTSGPDELPSKRTPKPRSFNEDVDPGPRRKTQNRDTNHPVKVFPSGKRVGRPPTKSKLQNVQRALSPAGSLLAPTQEAELHEAAEALVNQTVADQAAAALPTIKKKHAGGRPKKKIVEKLANDIGAIAALPKIEAREAAPSERADSVPAVKRKRAGGRPKKKLIDVEGAVEKMIADLAPLTNLNEVSIEASNLGAASAAVPAKKKHPGGRPKKQTARSQSVATSVLSNVETSKNKSGGKAALKVNNNFINSESEAERQVAQPFTQLGLQSRATTSASTSRPTTSSSRESTTSFGNFSGTRRSTRAISKTAPGSIPEIVTEEPSSSVSSNGKRKRSTQDTDSSTLIVDPAPIKLYVPSAKRPKVRPLKEEFDSADGSPELSGSQASRPKRKRTITEESTIAVAEPFTLEDFESASTAKKRKTAVHSYIDPGEAPKLGKRIKPALAPRAPSTRVRKPTRAALGLDGTDEYDEDELEQQFRSEYDHFQALSSPKNPAFLGKRNRKSVMDLAAAMETEDDEDSY